MKNRLFRVLGSVVFMFVFITGNGQDSLNYKIEGYCGKTKIRDINASYGEAKLTTTMTLLSLSAKQVMFDYGQSYKRDEDVAVNNERGKTLTFSGIAQVLNFFDYNGWEFVTIIEERNRHYTILFKKKR